MGTTYPARAIALVVVAALALAMPTAAVAGKRDDRRTRSAVAYLRGAQEPDGSVPAFSAIGSTADAVLAFSAAGTGRDVRKATLAYLRAQVREGNVNTPGLLAKVAMAATAAGWDARRFGGMNLLANLRSRIQPDGSVAGTGPFDHSLVLLALEGARGRPPKGAVVRSMVRWLRGAQCPDGGWSYDAPYNPATDDGACWNGRSDDFFTADSNTTSYAVMALLFAGRDRWIGADPFGFLRSARDEAHGGWGYSPDFADTDANSTALVIQAYLAAGRRVPLGGVRSLRRLQHDCGAFAYNWQGDAPGPPDTGATIGAVPAVARTPFPLLRGPKRIEDGPGPRTC